MTLSWKYREVAAGSSLWESGKSGILCVIAWAIDHLACDPAVRLQLLAAVSAHVRHVCHS